MGYLYVSVSIICMVYSQLILKWRVTGIGAVPVAISDKIVFLIKAFFDPFIISSFVAAFIASLFWMLTLSKLDLSGSYPIAIGGLAILTSICAIFFFNESISFMKIAGLIVIMIGMIILSKG